MAPSRRCNELQASGTEGGGSVELLGAVATCFYPIDCCLCHTPDELHKPIGIRSLTNCREERVDESVVKVPHLPSTGGGKFNTPSCADKAMAAISRVVKAHPHPGCHSCSWSLLHAHGVIEKFRPRHEFIDQNVGDKIGGTGVVLIDGRT